MTANMARALVLSHGDETVTAAVVRILEQDGWTVAVSHGDAAAAATMVRDVPLDGVVYVPGLLAGVAREHVEPASALLDLMEAVRPHLTDAEHGGARVVGVGCRDWLGWPTRPRVAAQAAGLIAAVRSLALAHGRAGVTVNAVIGMPPDAEVVRAGDPAPGTHLYEPVPLTGQPVTADDIAATVAFFLDPCSAYITGQVLHCCGGASLLSSLSV
jgi:NAD(P)-dependent dehydrogenase (short-subunit alcohol dehydrogenase family)